MRRERARASKLASNYIRYFSLLVSFFCVIKSSCDVKKNPIDMKRRTLLKPLPYAKSSSVKIPNWKVNRFVFLFNDFCRKSFDFACGFPARTCEHRCTAILWINMFKHSPNVPSLEYLLQYNAPKTTTSKCAQPRHAHHCVHFEWKISVAALFYARS